MSFTIGGRALLALALFSLAGFSATPQLQAISTLDASSHQITTKLTNTAKVPAVAWLANITQTDANGKVVGSFNLGEEHVYAFAYPDDPQEEEALQSGFIQPNQTVTRTGKADPKAVHVHATILAVIYADRRAEGNEKEIKMLFDGRAQDAKELAEVAASPESNAKKMAEHPELKTPPIARAQAMELQSRRVQ